MIISQTVETSIIEFTGGIDNGAEVVNWIVDNGGKAEWMQSKAGLKGYPELPEHICITKGSSRTYLWIGHSISKDELSGFAVNALLVEV